jgi:hypothetical protein
MILISGGFLLPFLITPTAPCAALQLARQFYEKQLRVTVQSVSTENCVKTPRKTLPQYH